ncbi:Maf family protein [Candidatus Gracilibacteria bacterium]|jgi:septum formation protein|nr:Maf family protein [Candidatus Gracilibacteria bacterium]
MKNTSKKIILASLSPRRKELLEAVGLKFEVHPSCFEEKEKHISPIHLALHNAIGKAQDIAKKHKNAIIIGVDTVVAYKKHIIGKPKNKADAKRILELLNGTTHRVVSAVCVIDTAKNKVYTDTEITYIEMDCITSKEIDAYIRHGEGTDKAAGYAIQGIGGLFIKKIRGDYFNVVGLPMHKLKKILEEAGVKII